MNAEVNGIVAICGSMKKAWDAMKQAKISFERAGYVVLLPTDPESSGIFLEEPAMSKELLTELHRRRIFIATEVYICNVGGYIGESTQEELDYPRKRQQRCRCGVQRRSLHHDIQSLCVSVLRRRYLREADRSEAMPALRG